MRPQSISFNSNAYYAWVTFTLKIILSDEVLCFDIQVFSEIYNAIFLGKSDMLGFPFND